MLIPALQHRSGLIFTSVVLSFSTASWAGMPYNPVDLTLNPLSLERVRAISFFLVVTFALAMLARWAWNSLATDFPTMPRLSIGRSFVLLSGVMLFVAVLLSMTTAARELMTPGAWQRASGQYKLTAVHVPAEAADPRKAWFQTLADRLIRHAALHAGRLPDHVFELAPELASTSPAHAPAAQRPLFIYEPGMQLTPTGNQIVLYEVTDRHPTRYCVLSDGRVELLSDVEFAYRVMENRP